MLRCARPLLASSSRAALASQKVSASASAIRRLPLGAANSTSLGDAPTSQVLFSRLVPTIQGTAYTTKQTPSGIQAGRDPEEERKFGQQKLESNPEAVSTESSVRHVYEPDTTRPAASVDDGIKHDLNIVKDTFRLTVVPKESYMLGLAGTLPYLATSISTVYLSWDLNTTWPTSSNLLNSIMLSHESAHYWLSVIEPIQLGYGAVIISFLGAIHWGLEYAEKTPSLNRTRFRYGIGVLSPVVAWPTLLMPIEFALTTQFAAFVGLYFADSRASVRGWAPRWYGTYRFVLTAVVGAAIVISLIGRAKVGDAAPRLTGLDEKFHERRGEQAYDEKWQKLENEEKARIKKEKAAAEKKKKEEQRKAKKKEQEQQGRGKKEENEKESKEDESGEDEGGEDEGGEDKKSGEEEEKSAKDDEKSNDDGKASKEGGEGNEK